MVRYHRTRVGVVSSPYLGVVVMSPEAKSAFLYGGAFCGIVALILVILVIIGSITIG